MLFGGPSREYNTSCPINALPFIVIFQRYGQCFPFQSPASCGWRSHPVEVKIERMQSFQELSLLTGTGKKKWDEERTPFEAIFLHDKQIMVQNIPK